MTNDIEKILMDENEIEATVSRIAGEIERDLRASGRKLLLLCILKGSMMFMGDLMKKLSLPMEIDFMKVSSYSDGATETSGKLKIHLDLVRDDLSLYDIVIVEDIIDSGNTLSRLCKYLRDRGAGSLRLCTLLDKPARRKVDIKADYVGKVIPDEFVVGYGLDFGEHYRNLPYVGILKPSVYEK